MSNSRLSWDTRATREQHPARPEPPIMRPMMQAEY